MKSKRVERFVVRAAGVLLASGLSACGSGMSPKYGDCDLASDSTLTAEKILGCISDEQWAAAEQDPYILNMVKLSVADATKGSYLFEKNREFSFEQGKPYVIKFINDNTATSIAGNTLATTADADHYVSDFVADGGFWGTGSEPYTPYTGSLSEVTQGRCKPGVAAPAEGTACGSSDAMGGYVRWSSNGFWRGVVVHKVVTRHAEYKAPFLLDFELNKPSRNDATNKKGTMAMIYFVPIKTGSHRVFCNISGHHGMDTTFSIVGDPNESVDFDLASDFDESLLNARERHDKRYTTDTSRLGGNPWGNADGGSDGTGTAVSYKTGSLGIEEASGSVSVVGATTISTASGKGYKYRLYKKEGSTGAYTLSTDFTRKFAIRKIQDVDVQMKPVYLSSVTLLESDAAADTDCGISTVDGSIDETATGNCKSYYNGSQNAAGNGNGLSGEKQVDLYIVPNSSSVGTYPITVSKSVGGELVEQSSSNLVVN